MLESKIHTEEMALILPEISDVYFEWNKKRYRLKSVDPTGSDITFEEINNPILTKQLEVGKRLPEFSFINIENQKEEIKKYKKRPTYIFLLG